MSRLWQTPLTAESESDIMRAFMATESTATVDLARQLQRLVFDGLSPEFTPSLLYIEQALALKQPANFYALQTALDRLEFEQGWSDSHDN